MTYVVQNSSIYTIVTNSYFSYSALKVQYIPLFLGKQKNRRFLKDAQYWGINNSVHESWAQIYMTSAYINILNPATLT